MLETTFSKIKSYGPEFDEEEWFSENDLETKTYETLRKSDEILSGSSILSSRGLLEKDEIHAEIQGLYEAIKGTNIPASNPELWEKLGRTSTKLQEKGTQFFLSNIKVSSRVRGKGQTEFAEQEIPQKDWVRRSREYLERVDKRSDLADMIKDGGSLSAEWFAMQKNEQRRGVKDGFGAHLLKELSQKTKHLKQLE